MSRRNEKRKIIRNYWEEIRLKPKITATVKNARIVEVKTRKKLKSGKIKEYISYRVYTDIDQNDADKKFVVIAKCIYEILRRIYDGRYEDLMEIVELDEKYKWVLNYVPYVIERAILSDYPELEPEYYRFEIMKLQEKSSKLYEKVASAMNEVCSRICDEYSAGDSPEGMVCDGVLLTFGVYPVELDSGKPGLLVYIKEVQD